MKRILLISIVALMAAACCQESKIKVACIGDSITEGFGISNQNINGYPEQLRNILGDKYTVINCGRSATTMMRDGDFPYWTCNQFSNALAFEPIIVVIKLGTNDTKRAQWNANSYRQSYQAMIDTIKTLQTDPIIFICTPVPAIKDRWTINDSTIVHGVIPIIEELAKTNNIEIIDLHTALKDKGEFFVDSIHPDKRGAGIMAQKIAEQILK